jgi:hypothetical protein
MNILCIAQVENREHIDKEIIKQTIQPTRTIFYIDREPATGINKRRERIAQNHKKLQDIVKAYKPDFVWQVEQDSVLPENALERLIGHYITLGEDVGFISGVQVGRHGLYALGAWQFDDMDNFHSVDYTKTGLQEVDATGFYCMFAPAKVWLATKCEWTGEVYGPDVVFGLNIGKKKYVDMDLHIGHKTKRGIIKVTDMSTCNVKYFIKDGRWTYKQL